MTTPVDEWIARVPFKAFQSRYQGRPPREEAASVTSDDWAIFSLHGNYVRPLRDYEWYPGEPCRLKSFASGKMFEIPPGSVPYSPSSMGHSATAWDPFVFPNPPRTFLMSQHMTDHCLEFKNHITKEPNEVRGILGFGLSGGMNSLHNGRLKYFRRRIRPLEHRMAAIPPIELDDLERQLWFDPEPRFERPFRTYADQKYCTKGAKLLDISQLMRPGW